MTNTQFQSLEDIRAIPVPYSTEDMRKYQAVSHMDLIDSIKEELDRRNIGIVNETYKTGRFGQQLYGNFLTNMNVDGEMSAAIHFTNSYDKTKRLQISSGALVLVCSNGMMQLRKTSNTTRKHVGAITVELAFMIEEAMNNMETEYKMLIEAKNHLKNIEVSKKLQAELAGRLFMEQDVLSVTQMSALKGELERPTNPFNTGTAWGYYNSVTQVLKTSHPVDYIRNHEKLHEFAMEVF